MVSWFATGKQVDEMNSGHIVLSVTNLASSNEGPRGSKRVGGARGAKDVILTSAELIPLRFRAR